MSRPTDIRVVGATLYFLPVQTRVPLKFGAETLTQVTCARVCLRVANRRGRVAHGWGETPLSVQWVWPGELPYARRHERLEQFCRDLARACGEFPGEGHALEVGHEFQEQVLPGRLQAANAGFAPGETIPWLAALVCFSAFDLALHDAFGRLVGRPIYDTYTAEFLSRDLASFLVPAKDCAVSFAGKFPADFLVADPPTRLPAWHLVGGLDLLDPAELRGDEPADGYPVVLTDWIRRDGLRCLKIKLRGTDCDWDWQRVRRVGAIALAHGVEWLSTDFNCTVTDPEYVTRLLERLRAEHAALYERILYVEQPFPYDLERHRIDVRSVSARKPLFLDESAHDWKFVALGRSLGWSGVALKTCKTQTGALLSACWAKAHGLPLMVQDLTNPMLAQLPHLQLAARVGTIMGVETNAMQFYPEASRPEAAVHPGAYQRRHGEVDLSTIRGPGLGYRLEEIQRPLPAPAMAIGMD